MLGDANARQDSGSRGPVTKISDIQAAIAASISTSFSTSTNVLTGSQAGAAEINRRSPLFCISPDTHSIFIRCLLDTHSIFIPHSFNVHSAFIQYSLDAHSTFTRHSFNIHSVFIRSSLPVHIILHPLDGKHINEYHASWQPWSVPRFSSSISATTSRYHRHTLAINIAFSRLGSLLRMHHHLFIFSAIAQPSKTALRTLLLQTIGHQK